MRSVEKIGALDPLTQSGTIVTNNITASCCKFEKCLQTLLRKVHRFQTPPSPTTWLTWRCCPPRCSQRCCWTPRSHNMWREPGLMSDSSNGLQGNQWLSWNMMKYEIDWNNNDYRSLGLGIKKEEAKESENGLDIYLCSFAAVMVAAFNRKKKTVKMV